MKHIIRSTTGALVAGIFAAGCSTSPPASESMAANTAISNAGQAIDRAAADPHVSKYASSELERATDSLQKARKAWNDKHDVQTTTHLAYLAQQRAATAQELASARAAEETVTVAAAERDQTLNLAAAQTRAKPTARTASTEKTPQGLAGFASGAARLPPNAMPTIEEMAITLRNNPGRSVVIEGHTDNVGNPKYNETLALERAQAVRSALVEHGVDPSRITVRSLGEQNPIASNDTSAGRRENRRADVIIGGMETQMVGSSQGSAATASGEGEQTGQNPQQNVPPNVQQNTQSEQNGQEEQRKE